MPLRTAQICHRYWTDYHWLSTIRAYPQTTSSSAAQESSRPSESWIWLGTKDVALKICSSYSELKELMKKIICSLIRQLIHGVTEINTMLKIENIVPRNWRNVKTHNLISGIKSEDTYGYVPDYTKPLTCIGCHIGFTFYPRPVLAFGYCHRLCLCVCPCVCVCVYQSLACPHDNSSAVHARITKFG